MQWLNYKQTCSLMDLVNNLGAGERVWKKSYYLLFIFLLQLKYMFVIKLTIPII